MVVKTAFVLMSFAEELKEVYDYMIKEALQDAGYTVYRADDIISQSNILEDIVKGIVKSDIIVADLTDSNPNVYYELGIAHALQKKVVLLTQDIDELPFDLRSYRVIAYDTHFKRMNKAKQDLTELAEKALTGTLPFGNPVKDYGNFKPDQLKDIEGASQPIIIDEESELGLLDYFVKLEEGFENLTVVLNEVSNRLSNELTPEINNTGEKLQSDNLKTKLRRNIIKELARHMQEYVAFIKPRNDQYRSLLTDVESSLEFILGGTLEISDEEDKKELASFLDVLETVESSAFDGRQGFISLIETQESLGKIEKNFNRANRFMIEELKVFVDNIDQTISIISRARTLGKALFKKEYKKVEEKGR